MDCIQSLIADYKKAGGVCPGGPHNADSGGYPEVETCDSQGLCSEETQRLLLEEKCKSYVFNNTAEVYQTIHWGLMQSMCTDDIYFGFFPSSNDKWRSTDGDPLKNSSNSRLIPISYVQDKVHGPISDLAGMSKNLYTMGITISPCFSEQL